MKKGEKVFCYNSNVIGMIFLIVQTGQYTLGRVAVSPLITELFVRIV